MVEIKFLMNKIYTNILIDYPSSEEEKYQHIQKVDIH